MLGFGLLRIFGLGGGRRGSSEVLVLGMGLRSQGSGDF